MKKVLSLLLVVLVLASFSVTAFAGPSQEAEYAPEVTASAVVDGQEVEVDVTVTSLEDAKEELSEEVYAEVEKSVAAANDEAATQEAAKTVLTTVTDEATKDALKARVAEKLGVDTASVDDDLLAANVAVSKVFAVSTKLKDGTAVTGTVTQKIALSEDELAAFVAPMKWNSETGKWEPVDYEIDEDGNLVFEADAEGIYGFLTIVEEAAEA